MGLMSAHYVNLSLSCMGASEGSKYCSFLVDSDGAVSKKSDLPKLISTLTYKNIVRRYNVWYHSWPELHGFVSE